MPKNGLTESRPWLIKLTARAQIPGRSIHPLVRDPVGFWGFDMLLTDGSAVQLDLPGFHVVAPPIRRP